MNIQKLLGMPVSIGDKYPYFYPIITAVFGTFLLLFPVLGVLIVGLPTMPALLLFEHLVPSSGQHIEYDLAWITYKTTTGVLFYAAMYFLYGVYMVIIKYLYEKLLSKKLNFLQTYLLSAGLLWIVLIAINTLDTNQGITVTEFPIE